MLDRANYVYWKVRMKAFIKFVDGRAWRSILNGREPLTIDVPGVRSPEVKKLSNVKGL